MHFGLGRLGVWIGAAVHPAFSCHAALGQAGSHHPKYINPRGPKIPTPAPVSFYVDYAAQDRVIAEDLTSSLKKYWHPQADSIQSAQAVFVLISRFKSDTEADSEKQTLFPILIQTNNDISKNLSRIQ